MKVLRINSLGGIALSEGNYTTDLLGLEGVEIEEFWESDSEIKIFFRMQRKAQPCPRCHTQTRRIHDYRLRTNLANDCQVVTGVKIANDRRP